MWGHFHLLGPPFWVHAFELRLPPLFDRARCLWCSRTLFQSITGPGSGATRAHDEGGQRTMRVMMRAAMKRARAARAMTMVMRMVGDKESKGNIDEGGGQQRRRGQ